MIRSILSILFGGSRNLPVEIIEALRPNAEAAAQRGYDLDAAVMSQFAAEFSQPRKGWFDQLVDGLNRLPRPLMTFGVFVILMLPVYDIVLATEVFTAWSIIPGPVWAVFGVIVTFFFGGRMQTQDIDFSRGMAGAAVALPQVLEQLQAVRAMTDRTPQVASTDTDAAATIEVVQPSDNPAISAWRNEAGG
jgi:hypothetical protein